MQTWKFARAVNVKRSKVLIVHNVIAPYRLPLFELLCNDLSIDMEVFYCSTGANHFQWDVTPRKYKYRYKVLPCISRKFSFLNPTVVFEIAKRNLDIIIVNGYVDITMQLAYALGKVMKIPVILWTEGIREPRTFLGLITRPIRMFFIKKADAIIVPGRVSRNYVISLGAAKSKVFIAPNCIDNGFFIEHSFKNKMDKGRLKKELGVNKDKVILYVGQLIERKGVDYLIRAYGRLKQEHEELALIIIGRGPLRNQLLHTRNISGISDVYFIGAKLKLVDLIKYYSITDFFVLPTLMDVWGFVINEAMACGLPIISTKNAQAATEMIHQGENGFIVNEANEEELYSAMKKLISLGELELMGKKSLEIVSTQFEPSLMKEGFVDAINHALRFNLTR
jgi:glycosyltransferase involved in cell wall biosynthesis